MSIVAPVSYLNRFILIGTVLSMVFFNHWTCKKWRKGVSAALHFGQDFTILNPQMLNVIILSIPGPQICHFNILAEMSIHLATVMSMFDISQDKEKNTKSP